jgi:hypothetical protein
MQVGSKRLPGITQRNVCPSCPFGAKESHDGDRTAARGDVLGSRLLPTDGAAMLQSGSPPVVGSATALQ